MIFHATSGPGTLAGRLSGRAFWAGSSLDIPEMPHFFWEWGFKMLTIKA
jgi:hypothetical protein